MHACPFLSPPDMVALSAVCAVQFLQWWFLLRLLRVFSMVMEPFQGTTIMSFVYRCLGARLGTGVVLHAAQIMEPDLLSIDDGDYIVFNAELRCHSFETGGVFVLGAVHIGACATLGPKATTQPGCFLADGASLGPLSVLKMGQIIWGSWIGAPARCLTAGTLDDSHVDLSSGMPSGLPCLVAVPISLYLSLQPMACVLAACGISTGHVWWLHTLKVVAVFWGGLVVAIITAILAKWVLIGKVQQPCTQVVSEWYCVRYWVVDRLMLGSPFRTATELLAGTPFAGAIFRMLGAKIGEKCMLMDIFVGAMVELGDGVCSGANVVLVGRHYPVSHRHSSPSRPLDSVSR